MRKFLLITGILVIALGAGLSGLGLYLDADSVRGDPNIGAAATLMFAEIFGVLGLGCLIGWAVTALVVKLRKRSSRHDEAGTGLS